MWASHTFDISLACHFLCAVASSSSLNPMRTLAFTVALTRALSRSMIGDLRKPGVRVSPDALSLEMADVSRSVIACLFCLSRKTTSKERLSLKYSSRLALYQQQSGVMYPVTYATLRNKNERSLKLAS